MKKLLTIGLIPYGVMAAYARIYIMYAREARVVVEAGIHDRGEVSEYNQQAMDICANGVRAVQYERCARIKKY